MATTPLHTRPLSTVRALLRKPDTTLEQLRWLFLCLCLVWSLVALPGSLGDGDAANPALGLVLVLVLLTWWIRGYRRQRLPWWSWPMCGVLVGVFLWAVGYDFGTTIVFLWINFHALYGAARDKALGALVVTGTMLAPVQAAGAALSLVVPTLVTAQMTLLVMHTMGKALGARDRATMREQAVVAASASLVAAFSRPDLVQATLVGAVSMVDDVRGAALATPASRARWQVAGSTDPGDGGERLFSLSDLPPGAAPALAPGGSALLTGAEAATVARVFGMQAGAAVALAPLSAGGDVFGLLALVLDATPMDELSASMAMLADQAALALDRLLASERLSVVVDHSPDALFLAADEGVIRFINRSAAELIGCPAYEMVGRDFRDLVHPEDLAAMLAPGADAAGRVTHLCRLRRGEDWIQVETVIGRVLEHDGSQSLVINARDVSDRHRLEVELRHAQKLESVGRLAAGIAHEINTPIQFVGDNVQFLQQSFTDLLSLRTAYTGVLEAAEDAGALSGPVAAARAAEDDVDVDFVLEEVPAALVQTLDGVSRVATIVRAMKAFGHPSNEEKAPADLNDAIANTLVVANNEVKYVADLETDFGDLPPVWCHLGDVNQVVLNLVVNAAHAVRAAEPERGRGVITVRTRVEGAEALVEVADTGTGIAPEIAENVFEPFFTTKEVGTGTGQGLALVRSLVDRHGGSIAFTTELGVGTTFTVRLPLEAAAPPAPATAEAVA